MNNLPTNAGGIALYVLGMLVFGALFRLGWNLGQVIWAAF